MSWRLTAIVERRDGNGYVALCPDADIASQGIPCPRRGTLRRKR